MTEDYSPWAILEIARRGGITRRNSDGNFQVIDHGLAVTARSGPGDDRRAHVRLTVEIDMAAAGAVPETVDWLTALAPVSVLVDLVVLTFACSTLAAFIVRVRQAVPDGAEIVLWRAGPRSWPRSQRTACREPRRRHG